LAVDLLTPRSLAYWMMALAIMPGSFFALILSPCAAKLRKDLKERFDLDCAIHKKRVRAYRISVWTFVHTAAQAIFRPARWMLSALWPFAPIFMHLCFINSNLRIMPAQLASLRE
jgi:hypothetical protein